MNEKTNELDWLAFRYVANELEPTEASEFESRLGEDQAAREAVAWAVGEASLIHAACHDQAAVCVASHDRNWNRSASRVFVVVGSCLSLVLAVVAVRFALQSPLDVVTQSTDGVVSQLSGPEWPNELALAWAETFDENFDADAVVVGRSFDSLDSDAANASSNDDTALVAPSWMLAALKTASPENVRDGIRLDIDLQE